ncbi:MAG: diacylglycerol kinase family protein [Pseudomonadales bacterium]
MNYAIVINQAAGSVKAGTEAISNWLEQHRNNPDLHLVNPKRIPDLLNTLKEQGKTRIALGGGDGTLSHAADFFVTNDIEMVPLPLGTLNHFARDLGIATDPAQWFETIAHGNSTAVDMGQINGRLFLNNFSVGLYPRLVSERQTLQDERILGSKRLATFWTSCKLLLAEHRTYHITFQHDGAGGLYRKCQAFMVSNNLYTGTEDMLTGRETLADGKLILYMPEEISPGLLVNMATAFVNNNLAECPGLDLIQTQSLTMKFRQKRIRVAVDGELTRMRSPLEVRVLPRKLKVVTPAGGD